MASVTWTGTVPFVMAQHSKASRCVCSIPRPGSGRSTGADTLRARTLLPPMTGRFLGGVGEFHGEESVRGVKVLCRFRWTRPGVDVARWEQAFSEDGGKTWEANWIMTFIRP